MLLSLSPALAACQPAVPTKPAEQSKPAETQPPITTPPSTSVSQPPPASTSNVVSWAPDGTIASDEYQKSKTYGDYVISWSSNNQYIFIGIKAKTTGWVAVGFGPELLMKNADIVEGYVNDGKVTILDMFSIGDFGPHPPDIQQGGTNDILEYGGKEENGFTVIEFKRRLDTGDKFDKPLIKGINKILWGYGAEDTATLKHSARGWGGIDL